MEDKQSTNVERLDKVKVVIEEAVKEIRKIEKEYSSKMPPSERTGGMCMNLKSKDEVIKHYYSRRNELHKQLETAKSKKQREIIIGKIYELDDFVKNILE